MVHNSATAQDAVCPALAGLLVVWRGWMMLEGVQDGGVEPRIYHSGTEPDGATGTFPDSPWVKDAGCLSSGVPVSVFKEWDSPIHLWLLQEPVEEGMSSFEEGLPAPGWAPP